MDCNPQGPVGELGRKAARSTLKNSLWEPFWKGGPRKRPKITGVRGTLVNSCGSKRLVLVTHADFLVNSHENHDIDPAGA